MPTCRSAVLLFRSFVLLFLICVLAPLQFVPARALAQTPTPQLTPNPAPFDFYTHGPYRDDIPRPGKLLGYEPGEFQTTYANVERVIREYTGKSDRLKVIERERTVEYRTMYLLVVSAPENLAKLDQIKTNLGKLADPRTLANAEEAETIVKNTPSVIWLSYTIHGNESAGVEASMQVLYELIASNNPKIQEWLKNVVVVMNPCQNPDGHERFATWYNAVGIGRGENFAYEHREPWSVYGRNNHFLFDLNRDLVALSQIESQSATKAFRDWHPQVSADHHGQTANFFFPPAALPINPNVSKETTEKWLDIFGRGNAAAFDRYGWNYYVRDVFDLFYPGYWDSWPSLNGATGMTYETDGGGWKGLNWKRDDDTSVTFRDGIARHVTASLATIETTATNREARLRDYLKFFRDALEEGQKGKIRQFLLVPGKDPGRTAKLVGTLVRHGIEVQQASEAFSAKSVRGYFGESNATREFPAGTYVISLSQPQARLAKSLLEKETKQDDEFIKRQNDKRARNERRGTNAPKDDSDFYDVTAWTMPLAHGVEGYWTEETATVKGDFVVGTDQTALTLSTQPKGGTTRTTPIVADAGVTAKATTAYVFTPETEAGDHLALQLLKEGYRVATAVRPLRAGGKDYARGAFLLRTERNPETLHNRIAQLAREYGVRVDAVNTAYTDQGITGVGSEAIVTLKAPKIAIITDEGVSQTSYGATWFTLSRDFGVEFVPISMNTFKNIRMADFNILILCDGSAGAYKAGFGKDGIEKLKRWCDDGGTLMCIGNASAFAADKDVDLTSARLVGPDDEESGDEADSDEWETSDDSAGTPPAAAAAMGKPGKESKKKPGKDEKSKPEPKKEESKDDAEDKKPKKADKTPLFVPGAIMRAKVNREHFLTFGFEQDELAVLVNSSNFFKPSKTGTNVLTFEAKDLRLSGFVWEGNTEKLLRQTGHIIEEQVGGGHVILYTTEPNFRYIWHGSTRLFLNGLIYAPTVSGFATGIK
ncbi:MAG: hypothetical protein K1Y36_02955 [Blastocatellia bacterium]|nr:hypothetical protein [Blastocatellia bacterium]